MKPRIRLYEPCGDYDKYIISYIDEKLIYTFTYKWGDKIDKIYSIALSMKKSIDRI